MWAWKYLAKSDDRKAESHSSSSVKEEEDLAKPPPLSDDDESESEPDDVKDHVQDECEVDSKEEEIRQVDEMEDDREDRSDVQQAQDKHDDYQSENDLNEGDQHTIDSAEDADAHPPQQITDEERLLEDDASWDPQSGSSTTSEEEINESGYEEGSSSHTSVSETDQVTDSTSGVTAVKQEDDDESDGDNIVDNEDNNILSTEPDPTAPSVAANQTEDAYWGLEDEEGASQDNDFSLAHNFLVDNEDENALLVSLYADIAGEEDEGLMESFRFLGDLGIANDTQSRTTEMAEPTTSGSSKNRPAVPPPTKAAVPKRISHENQALFDILTRDFASVTTSRFSIQGKPLSPTDLTCCFAAFVACFTPPPPTHFATIYNDANFDESSTKEEGNYEDWTSSQRPYVPLDIVNALWTQVLLCRLEKSITNFAKETAITPEVLSFVCDTLVLLGILDVRQVPTASQPQRGDDGGLGSSPESSVGTTHTVISVHQNIHQEYGEYLLSRKEEDAVQSLQTPECSSRLHRSIVGACSRDPGHPRDAGYAVQLLPWNLICANHTSDAANLLKDKRFVRRRLQALGHLVGTTAQVTDTEALVRHVFDHQENGTFGSRLLEDSNAVTLTTLEGRSAMLEAYEQTRKELNWQVKDHNDEGGAGMSSGIHSGHFQQMQVKVGKALHLMGVSMGAESFAKEEMDYCLQALEMKRAAAVGDGDNAMLSVTISDTLHCIGFSLDNAGKYLEAMEYYDEALHLRQTYLGDDDLRVAETLHNKGAILCENGACDAAMECLEEALRIRKLHLGELHELCADTLQWIGNVMREWERFDEALDYFKSSLHIKKSALGMDHEDVANTLQNMAVVLDDMASYSASLKCYQEALRIYLRHYGRESFPVADTMQFIANVYVAKEENKLALDMYSNTIEIRETLFEREPDSTDVQASVIHDLIVLAPVDVDEISARYEKILDCYEEVLPLVKLLKGSADLSLTRTLHRMGDIYWKLHDWGNSVESYQEALRVYRNRAKAGDVDEGEICQILQKKGTIHLFRKEYQKGKSCFESVIQRVKRLKEASFPSDASTIYCLGVAFHHLGVHKLAVVAFTKALRIWTTEGGETHINCGYAMYWIARQDAAMGRLQHALNGYRGALHVYKMNKQCLDYAVVTATLQLLGEAHSKLGDSHMALKSYNEAVRLIRRHLDEADETLIPVLINAGKLYEASSEYSNALKSFQDAIRVMKLCGRSDTTLCSTTEKIGELQGLLGENVDSKNTLTESYRLYESLLGQDNLVTAGAVYKLGKVLDKLNSYDAAVQCYRECFRVQKMKLGIDHKDVATTLVSIGTNSMQRRMYRDATVSLQQALSIQRAVFGDSADEVVSTLHFLGLAYKGANSVDKAVVCFKEALRILQSSNTDEDIPTVAQISFDMARAQEENGSSQAAIGLYKEALSIWDGEHEERCPLVLFRLGCTLEKIREHSQAVDVLSDAREKLLQSRTDDGLLCEIVRTLARNQAAAGDDASAIECYLEHIALLKASNGDDETLSDTFYELASVRLRMGDLAVAVKNYKACLAIRKEIYDGDDERVARVLHSLSVVHEKLEDDASARDCLSQAISIFEVTGNEKETSSCHQALGRIFLKERDLIGAVNSFEKALSMLRTLVGSTDVQVASVLHSLGFALLEDGKPDKALEYCLEGLRIRQSKCGSTSYEAAETQAMMGRALLVIGDNENAIESCKAALDIFKKEAGPEAVDEAGYSHDPKSLGVGDCNYCIGSAYLAIHEYELAAQHLFDAIPVQSQFYGSDSIELADTYYKLSEALRCAGKYSRALEIGVNALRIRKLALGNESIECALSLRQIGAIQEASEKDTEALNCFIEALRVFTIIQGKSHENVASSLLSIGRSYTKLNEYDKAIDNLRRSLSVYKEKFGPLNAEVSDVICLLANVESLRGDSEGALNYYKESLQINNHIGDDKAVARVLYEIGVVLESRGDNGEAMECYNEILRRAIKDDVVIAKAHNRIGGIRATLEDYDTALESFEDALSIYKEKEGEEAIEVAETLHNIAGVYEARSELDASHPQFTEALRIFRNHLGEDDLAVARVLGDLGINCAKRKEYAKAIEFCSEALRIRRLVLGPNHLDSCDAVYNIANVLDEWGKDAQAMKFYEEALALYKTVLGTDDLEVANCHQCIGFLFMRMGQQDLALRSCQDALLVYQAKNEESIGVASLHFCLGEIQTSKNEKDIALDSYLRCLRIRKRELGEFHVDVGTVCDRICGVYIKKSMYAEAKNVCSKAIQIFDTTTGKDSVSYAKALVKMATILSEEESYDEAMVNLRFSLETFKREFGEESDEAADVLMKIGVIHNKRVDYEEALTYLTSALKIRSTLLGRDDVRVAETLFEIGSVLEEWGDSCEALETYREILRILKLNFGQNHELIRKVHVRVGDVYMERSEYDAALGSFQEAFDVERRLHGDNSEELGHILVKIGGVHDARGEADAALVSYSESLKIFKKTLGSDDVAVALALNNLGINYARRRNYPKAIEHCSEALRIRKLKLGDRSLDVADSCLNVANILDEWGKDEQALKFYDEAKELYRDGLGPEDTEVANCFQHIGSIYMKLNNNDEALVSFVESIRIYRLKVGEDSLEAAVSLFNMGRLYGKRAEYEKSLACFNECLRIRKSQLGDQHIDVIAVHRYIDAITRKMRR